MFLPFAILFVANVATAVELASSPAKLRSLNGTGFSSWQNLEDARCDTPRAAAVECYARADTEVLEARGFDFDLSTVSWLEARWDVNVVPVPVDGWILSVLQLRWGESVLDLSSPNHTSHDEGVSFRIRATGDVDWRNVSMRIAFESTNEDTTFLLTCVELRAGSEEDRPEPAASRIFRHEVVILTPIFFALSIVEIVRRVRMRRRRLVRSESASELMTLTPDLYPDDVRVGVSDRVVRGDPFVDYEISSFAGHAEVVACRLKKSTDLERFRRLQRVRHVNLASFLGIHDGGSLGHFSLWIKFAIRLDDWRRDQEPCPALGLRISQVAACAVAALQNHLYTHGDVACRNFVVCESGRMMLTGAGHARGHDVEAYVARDNRQDPLRWMAPEAIRHDVLDLATDRWSLGVTIWEACSAPESRPFDKMDAKTFVETDDLELEQPELATDAVWGIAQACLRANRDERASAEHVRNALLDLGKSLGVSSKVREEGSSPLLR